MTQGLRIRIQGQQNTEKENLVGEQKTTLKFGGHQLVMESWSCLRPEPAATKKASSCPAKQ